MVEFNTPADLHLEIANKGLVAFISEYKKLNRVKVLLFSIATGDFNPAHCVPGFEQYSFFKSMVSHGIGTVARAESEFLRNFRFSSPSEIIATRLEDIKYLSPLRVGEKYQYVYFIHSGREKKNFWEFECKITCKTFDGRTIADWKWVFGIVEHKNLPKEAIRMLRPKSYRRNLIDALFLMPTATLGRLILVWGIIFLLFSYMIFALGGLIKPVDMQFMGP